ncbi:hypothetical protein DPMN_049235 [Dreissena polymorpha]|uniref:Uncharacterized protein n=1 Tax=Dreissena polymorpha TaxID=45954 RepID=A0A9D4HKB3_DREPO|nr:hypothetical protein DPMN_049235 [Dreissena polymorpha]
MKFAFSVFAALIIGITGQHVCSVTLTADSDLRNTVFSLYLFTDGMIKFVHSLFYNVEQAFTCDIHTHGRLKPVLGFRPSKYIPVGDHMRLRQLAENPHQLEESWQIDGRITVTLGSCRIRSYISHNLINCIV